MFKIKGPILAAVDLDKGSEEILRQADSQHAHTTSNLLSVMSFPRCLPRSLCILNCILAMRWSFPAWRL